MSGADKKISNILITGATGFLGSRILEMLVHDGYYIFALVRPQSNHKRISALKNSDRLQIVEVDHLEDCLHRNEIHLVVHLATCYGRNGESVAAIEEANYILPKRIVDACVVRHVPYFINTHTVLKPEVNDYARFKHAFFHYLNECRDSFSKIIHIVPEYFYGPGDDEWKLITMILRRLHDGASSIDFTSGVQRRNFIYIDDMVNAYRLAMQNIADMPERVKELYVGNNSVISIKELAMFCKSKFPESQTFLNFGGLPDREQEVNVYDNQALTAWGWRAKWTLESGIAQTIAQMWNIP